jgi:hypothetical protein
MVAPVKTKVEELEGSKVRLEVEVPEAAVAHAYEHAARDMAQDLRVPGFRKGKVPLPVVAARVGREALWQEAIRSHIDGWFWEAAATSGVRPVAGPEVEWDELPTEGGTFRFAATVPVAPKPELADWTSLEVPVAEPEVPGELVDHELERIRDSVAELVPVEGRGAREGDTVVLDLVATEQEGGEPSEFRDYVAELGDGRLADELEQAIPEMSEGETRELALDLPEGGREGHRHAQGGQGARPARARRRARARRERVRHARGAPGRRPGDSRSSSTPSSTPRSGRTSARRRSSSASTVEGIELPSSSAARRRSSPSLVRSLERAGRQGGDVPRRRAGRAPRRCSGRTVLEAERAVSARARPRGGSRSVLGVEVTDDERRRSYLREAADAGRGRRRGHARGVCAHGGLESAPRATCG